MFFWEAYSQQTSAFSHYYFHGGIHFDNHFHTDYEVNYVVSGTHQVVIDNQEINVQAGDFILILPNQIHATHDLSDDLVLWFALFSQDLVSTFTKDMHEKTGKTALFHGQGTFAEKLLQPYLDAMPCGTVNELIPGSAPGNKYEVQALLYAICAEYARQVEIIPMVRADDDLSVRIAQYIQANFQKNLTLSGLAEALNYNVYYLSCFINQTFRMNFRQYLNTVRINYAKQLLHETKQPITRISSECGYQSIRTFNHAFQLQTGFAPSVYREITSPLMYDTVDPSVSSQYIRHKL